MFPSRSSLPALTAFARPGPVACRSPASSLVFGHPTPSTSSAPALAGRPPVFPWASYLGADACFCVPHGSRRDTGRPGIVLAGASEAGRRSPVARIVSRGRSRVSQVTGVSSCYVLQSNIPPVPRELAISPSGDAAFRRPDILRTGILAISGLPPCGPRFAFLRINRPVTATAARSATGLLARLWPDGICTRWTPPQNFTPSSHRHSFLTSIAWSLPGPRWHPPAPESPCARGFPWLPRSPRVGRSAAERRLRVQGPVGASKAHEHTR
jgi:hypothetical protein